MGEYILGKGSLYINGQRIGQCDLPDLPMSEQVKDVEEKLSREFGMPVSIELKIDHGPLAYEDLRDWQRNLAREIIEQHLAEVEHQKPPFWAKKFKGQRS